jgi:predicted nucleotidyltransferase
MYFPESSIITTKDGLQCLVYSNEHPEGYVIVKPKYIPTDKISSDSLPYRFILGKKVNRLDLWIDRDSLRKYLEDFARAYPHYIFKSNIHDEGPLFFAVPKDQIDKIYLPREGLKELMAIPHRDLDEHLKKVVELILFFLKSGLELNDFGVTYSTIMGYYSQNMSDINVVVYGKDKFWKLMEFLENNDHPNLRWKTYEEWEKFYRKRNRHLIHNKETYLKNMDRKKSEGFFKETLFIIFSVEREDETWFRWGDERYRKVGNAKFKAIVKDNKDSVVRPGCYKVENSRFIDGDNNCRELDIDKVAFHSRDYCMFAFPGEEIEIKGVVEEVNKKDGGTYYRIVVGYFDAYLNGNRNRDGEYIRIVDD